MLRSVKGLWRNSLASESQGRNIPQPPSLYITLCTHTGGKVALWSGWSVKFNENWKLSILWISIRGRPNERNSVPPSENLWLMHIGIYCGVFIQNRIQFGITSRGSIQRPAEASWKNRLDLEAKWKSKGIRWGKLSELKRLKSLSICWGNLENSPGLDLILGRCNLPARLLTFHPSGRWFCRYTRPPVRPSLNPTSLSCFVASSAALRPLWIIQRRTHRGNLIIDTFSRK